ncbi:MAG: alanine/glycine:cation symporter family protein [Verrucomicrobiota bacterium]
MAVIEKIISDISNLVWGLPLIILLMGTHLFLTFRLGFIQRFIGYAIMLSFRREKGEGDVSHFASLATAMAATVGTGNIVGVATAIAAGGPGAVLWMWLTGVFGIATKYAEALLSVKYRIKAPNGEMAGGPMYVLERALNLKWLAILFALFTILASFGIGNAVQANSIAQLTKSTLNIPPWMTGMVMTLLTGVVILGGIQWISKVCRILVPFMILFYVTGCCVILASKFNTLSDTIYLIITSAFSGQAAIGGFAGAAVRDALRYGIARGLFSNESGMGSAPIVAAAAKTTDPVRQALVSSTGTFWDTVVICALTGIMLVNSGEWQNGYDGAHLTKAAFEQIPVIGPLVLNLGLFTFVFSTILGWGYYGEKAAEYVFSTKAIIYYRWAWTLAVMFGSVVSVKMIFDLADIFNGLMSLPNLISLLLLNGVVAAETKRYFSQRKRMD